MDEKKIQRINELARKKKTVGLNEAEIMEQQELRAEYIAAIKGNIRQSLESIKIQNPDGTLIDVKKRYEEKMNQSH